MRTYTPLRQSLLDLFREFCDLPSEYVQYDDGFRTWRHTYAQIGAAARAFAARLARQGIGKGDRVIFWSENRPEWIAAFWGCLLAGAVVVPVDYHLSLRFLRQVEDAVRARLILVGQDVRIAGWEGQPPVWNLWEAGGSAESDEGAAASLGREDVAEIVFTSGATGAPKGVLITHGNILANLTSAEQIVLQYRKWFRPLFPIRFLSLIPLSHMFGQALTLFIVPMIPGGIVFTQGYSPHEIARQIRGRRVSAVVAVPKILQVLRKQAERQFPESIGGSTERLPWGLRWWKYRRVHAAFGWKFWAFVVGGAPLPRELEEFWSGLGYAVVQGYGLTETAPIVAFNNPFDIREGTVGKPIAGVEVKVAADGEILVRGESVTPGYFGAPADTAGAFENGWFHTGDLGAFDEAGHLAVRGRKKEMIVTPEGLNVFPEDVENVLNEIPGVRESAVVGRDHVHAVLVLEGGADANEIVRQANQRLEEHQKIRSVALWPGGRLPRTESTQKLKHPEIQAWLESGSPQGTAPPRDELAALLQPYAPNRSITLETTLDQLGLSSLDRVELLLDLEEKFETSLDEAALAGTRTVASLAEIGAPARPAEFPAWNRSWAARAVRGVAQAAVLLPLARAFARARVSGREHLASLRGPAIFAPNHQSHLDTPLILSALPPRYRSRTAVAMWKEYFDAHFSPERHGKLERLRDSALYWLAALLFNAFPIPQSEAGARQSLRYLGELVSEGWSVLYFPEGERTEAGEIKPFQPGIGLLAAHLGVPIVPVRLRGVEKVLHRHAHWPRPGQVEISFGRPLRLPGEDYLALAKQVEEAVRAL